MTSGILPASVFAGLPSKECLGLCWVVEASRKPWNFCIGPGVIKLRGRRRLWT
jgi:hypothetical protein